jgi:hypothetical protein
MPRPENDNERLRHDTSMPKKPAMSTAFFSILLVSRCSVFGS